MLVYFHTLGCKVNQYETAALRRFFAERGWRETQDAALADAVVVNSCTVTAESDRKTRQAVRRLRREAPGAALALCGCYAQAWPGEARELAEADVVLGAGNRRAVVEAVERFLEDGRRIVEIPPHRPGERFEPMCAEDFGERTRAFLKIEDGCENRCAYCIIPDARGYVRSKPLSDILAEARRMAVDGRREVVLTGINLSAYGRDTGGTLAEAARAVAGVQGVERIRFGSLEPDTLVPEEIRMLAERCGGKICPQFHLSLQSGCDTVLARMGRRYDTDGYRRVASALREAFPGAALTTDVMAGFPGETEQEHAASVAFVREIGFARVHVFAYSVRPGTPAAAMPDQVPAEIKRRRSAELLSAAAELRGAHLRSLIGACAPVLFERGSALGQTGYTPDYTQVAVPGAQDLRGEIREVRLTGLSADGDGMVGELTGAEQNAFHVEHPHFSPVF